MAENMWLSTHSCTTGNITTLVLRMLCMLCMSDHVSVCMCVCVSVCVCLRGSVTFQTEGFVTASECCGAAMQAISLCCFLIFNKSVFWASFISALTQQHNHTHTHINTENHTQNTSLLFSTQNDLSQLLIQAADAMCFSCCSDRPFSWDLHVLFQSKRDRKSNLSVLCYKVQITLRENAEKMEEWKVGESGAGGGGGV